MSEKKTLNNENKLNSLMPLWLFLILREKTSAKNPLSRQEIEDILETKHHISFGDHDRKKTTRYINTLCAYFEKKELDGVIVKTEKQAYYEDKGCTLTVPAWYLDPEKAPASSGIFSAGEVNFLTDMLEESKIISSDCTTALIRKLAASVGEVERKELRPVVHHHDAYKSENRHLLEIKDKVDEAISDYKQVKITYEINNKRIKLTLLPIEIDQIDGKYYLRAYWEKKLRRFYLENIKSISIGEEPAEFVGDDKYELEDENTKLSKSIALDALFSNTREINYAIKHNKYLTFTYLSYRMDKDNKVKLASSHPQTVIAINTAYKDGKPYLIAIDPSNEYMPVFYRIDLMKDIKAEETVDFMEYRKFDAKDSNEYTDKHPFMLSGFTKIRATFLIKADFLDRVIDAFGNKAMFHNKQKAFESLDGNLGKLARAFHELDFSDAVGFDHNENLVRFTVETTDEEAFRFALQNSDVVELVSPLHLREQVLDVSKQVQARYSKTLYDRTQKAYREAISGEGFLSIGTANEADQKAYQQIKREKACGMVKKLKIQSLDKPLPIEELEKFENVEELVIEGNGVSDFSWIAKSPALRELAFINTDLEDGNVLDGIAHLDVLFITGNHTLKDYEFLKNMDINSLYIGRNGKSDLSALHELKGVKELVLQEDLLAHVNLKLFGSLTVKRWIDNKRSETSLPLTYRLPHFLVEE